MSGDMAIRFSWQEGVLFPLYFVLGYLLYSSLFAGLVLRQYGTGPVRGFATTLIIGIIASLFTSIVVTRVMMDYLLKGQFRNRISV